MTDLNELLERVKKAPGPDRELDADLARALGWAFIEGDGEDRIPLALPCFTFSADDAMRLAQNALPARWEIAMGTCGEEDMPWACLTEPDEPCRDFSANAPTMELAIVEALLSAVIAIGDQS
ncbi:hypothetical protein [Devosia sp.]|uniref:hypothetical protein n=1 Tax=Devosia sp. TaxID=1871048 RepID=UPI001B149166|nr:hypothetical protein [Devosia sp.]MBO9589583.1 hypothetical protein [Devosia sp.]